MNTGHRGALTTLHASSAPGALRRLRTLAMRGSNQATTAEIDDEIRATIDYVVHIHRNDHHRFVQQVLRMEREAQSGAKADT
jgi:Flp pilus assembly CpaF family ATPase